MNTDAKNKLIELAKAREKRNDFYRNEQDFTLRFLANRLGHNTINVYPPKDKNLIKEFRKKANLSCSRAAMVCGVTRKTWTMWENYSTHYDYQLEINLSGRSEPYPSDWQWGWFLLATNQHPTLILTKRDIKSDPVPDIIGLHYPSLNKNIKSK